MQVQSKKKINVKLLALIVTIVLVCATGVTFAWLAFRERLTNISGSTAKIELTTSYTSNSAEIDSIRIVAGTPLVAAHDKDGVAIKFNKERDSESCYVRIKAMLVTKESLTDTEQAWLDEVNATMITTVNATGTNNHNYSWTQSWGGYYYLVEAGQEHVINGRMLKVDTNAQFDFCKDVVVPYDSALFYEQAAISLNLTFVVEVQAIQSKNVEDGLTRKSAAILMNQAFNESFDETSMLTFDTSYKGDYESAPNVRPIVVKKSADDKFYISELPTPEWRSKRFEGWYKTPEFNDADKVERDGSGYYVIEQNETYYAKWTQLVYIDFEYMSGEDTTAGTLTIDGYFDEEMRLPVIFKTPTGQNGTEPNTKGVTLIWFTEDNTGSEYYLGGSPIRFKEDVADPAAEGSGTESGLPQEYEFSIVGEAKLYGAWYYTGSIDGATGYLNPNNEYMTFMTDGDTEVLKSCKSTYEKIYIPPIYFGASSSDNLQFYSVTGLKGTVGNADEKEDGVFGVDTKVSDILYGTGVSTMGEYTFYKCKNLKNIKISSKITTIGSKTIYGCNSLEELTIGEDIEDVDKSTINNAAVYECSVLTLIKFKSSVGEINGRIYDGEVNTSVEANYKTYALTGLEFDDLEAVTFNTVEISGNTFYALSGIYKCEIIDNDFEENLKLATKKNIVGPNSGNYFASSNISETPESVQVVQFQTLLHGHDNNSSAFRVENGVAVMVAIVKGGDTEIISVPNYVVCGGYNYKVEELGYNFTSGSENKKYIVFNDFVTVIRDKAFSGCTEVLNINLPKTLKSIGVEAFNGCTKLKTVNIATDSALTEIKDRAFALCTGLTEIYIPENVKVMGSEIFSGCVNLLKIYYYAENNISNNISTSAFNGLNNDYRVYVYAENYHDLIDSTGNLKFLVDTISLTSSAFISDFKTKYAVFENTVNALDRTKEDFLEKYILAQQELVNFIAPINNRIRSIETYNVAFVKNDELLGSDTPLYSFDELKNADTRINDFKNLSEEEKQNKTLKDVFKAGVCYGDFFVFADDGYDDELFEGWNTQLNGCGVSVNIYDLFGYDYQTRAIYSIRALKTNLQTNYNVDPITSGEYSGGLIIKGYSSASALLDNPVLEIPNRIKMNNGETKPVYKVNNGAFKDNTTIVRATVMAGIKEVGSECFSGCSKLSSIIFETGVTELGAKAFYKCKNLQSVTLPNTISNIYEETFYECIALKNITIPATVKKVGERAFYGCTGLTTANFVNSTEFRKRIEREAFYECTALRTIKLPVAVEYVGQEAFYGCKNLKEVDFSLCIYMESIFTNTFVGCEALDTVKLSDELKYIESNAFKGCENLITFNMPTNLREIGDSAFEDCKKMQVIDLAPTSITTIGTKAFYNCEFAFFDFEIPNLVTLRSIGNSAFEGCTNMRTIDFPSVTLTTVANNLFTGCTMLSDVVLRTTNIISGTATFSGCVALKNVELDVSDSLIGTNAFNGCVELLNIKFSDQIVTVGDSAFYNCEKVSTIDFSTSKIAVVENNAFYNCKSLVAFFASPNNNISKIGDYAFYGCVLLGEFDSTKIAGTANGIRIGTRAFAYCTSLGTFKITQYVTSLGNEIFYHIPVGGIKLYVHTSNSTAKQTTTAGKAWRAFDASISEYHSYDNYS